MQFTNAEKLAALNRFQQAARLGLFRHPRIKYAASKNRDKLGRELQPLREEQQGLQEEHVMHDSEHGTPLFKNPAGKVVRRLPAGGLRVIKKNGDGEREEEPYGPERYASEEQLRAVLSQLDFYFKSAEDREAYEAANGELLEIEEDVDVHQVDGALLDDRENFDPEVLRRFDLGPILWMFEKEG